MKQENGIIKRKGLLIQINYYSDKCTYIQQFIALICASFSDTFCTTMVRSDTDSVCITVFVIRETCVSDDRLFIDRCLKY